MKIIAEIGSNWRKFDSELKNWDVAKYQIETAKEFGATGVKFQFFTAQELFGPQVIGTRFERDINQYALPQDWLPKLKAKCDEVEIEFLCSAFSLDGFKVVDNFVETHKLASPERTDPNLVAWLETQDKPFYYSDGCGGTHLGKGIPMACVSQYPAHFLNYELYSGQVEWGLSDHTPDDVLVIMALRQGATHFEKHVDFCPNDGDKTPDSGVSVDGHGWTSWVKAILGYDGDRRQSLKDLNLAKYGRRETIDGYFRPIPPDADLGPAFPTITGGKL